MSTTYQPGNSWPEFTPQQAARIRREFDSIKQAWERDKPSERFTILHAEPSKATAGDVVYADGTDWNPGDGAGLYVRNEDNDSWVFAGASSSGTWTPALTFTTPGDLAVVYSTQGGTYTKHGRLVTASFQIQTSTFTHTTASGDLRITGLPFTNNATYIYTGALSYGGITAATRTQFNAQVGTSADFLSLRGSGSGVAAANANTANVPTGGTVVLRGTITYHI